MFVTVSRFHPSLIFAGKTESLPIEWNPVNGSIKLVPEYLSPKNSQKYFCRVASIQGNGSSLSQNCVRLSLASGKCSKLGEGRGRLG